MSGEDHEGEPLTASALLAYWESLRRPGEPERLPLEPGSLYEIDREGSVFRVSPLGPPEPLAPVGFATASEYAAREPDFDPKRWKRYRERCVQDLYRSVPACALVYGPAGDRWTQAVRLSSDAEQRPAASEDLPPGMRGPLESWAGGGPLPAVGGTDRGWFLLNFRDGSSLLFHGPSKAAEVFGRHREASGFHRGS